MKLEKLKHRMRCEMGACGNPAVYSIKMDRAGVRSNINVCRECLESLYRLTRDVLSSRGDDYEEER